MEMQSVPVPCHWDNIGEPAISGFQSATEGAFAHPPAEMCDVAQGCSTKLVRQKRHGAPTLFQEVSTAPQPRAGAPAARALRHATRRHRPPPTTWSELLTP